MTADNNPITECALCKAVLSRGVIVTKEDFPGSAQYGRYGLHGVIENETPTETATQSCPKAPDGLHIPQAT